MMRLVLVTALQFFCCMGLFGQQELIAISDHGSDPGNLKMFMHLPKFPGDSLKKRPLVVVLHGCSQNAASVARQSGWNKLADTFGFFVLYPQQKFSNNPNGCFNWFRKKDIFKNEGEVLSIRQMIAFAIDSFPVDTSRIFVYGLSAGAAMSVALLADYPELFNAGAILAGGPFMSATNAAEAFASMTAPRHKTAKELAEPVLQQNPQYLKKFPRMVIVHGKNDPVVNIKNAYSLVRQWSYLHRTDTLADSTITSFQAQGIAKYLFRNSQQEDVIIYYEAEELGHAIMVDPGTEIYQGGETGVFAVDKDFFSTYWIAKDFGLIEEHLRKR